jgi:hypothetical protein
MAFNKTRLSATCKLLVCLMAGTSGLVLIEDPPTLAQCVPQSTPRKITSEDFTKNRKSGAQPVSDRDSVRTAGAAGGAREKQVKRTYQLASTRPKTTQSTTGQKTLAQLGITIWRLRPSTTNDTGARMLVREKSTTAEVVPVRVEAGTTFHEGDQIRLSIEPAAPGYLYVIDRELLSDGSTGAAMLIYPWAGMPGDNRAAPGKLIDIPAQEDDPSFFTARRSGTHHAGELLTIIVTSSPLNLPIAGKPIQISNEDLAKWERLWGGQTDRFELEGGAGETWTAHEQQASAHSHARQLTREDPGPQTIYRVSVSDNRALLVNVRLNYGR